MESKFVLDMLSMRIIAESSLLVFCLLSIRGSSMDFPPKSRLILTCLAILDTPESIILKENWGWMVDPLDRSPSFVLDRDLIEERPTGEV